MRLFVMHIILFHYNTTNQYSLYVFDLFNIYNQKRQVMMENHHILIGTIISQNENVKYNIFIYYELYITIEIVYMYTLSIY